MYTRSIPMNRGIDTALTELGFRPMYVNAVAATPAYDEYESGDERILVDNDGHVISRVARDLVAEGYEDAE